MFAWAFQCFSQVFTIKDAEENKIRYKILQENTVELVKLEKRKSTTFNIPTTISYQGKELTVVSIGEWAFHLSPITSITIPNSVTNIGKLAFYNCESLTLVVIPNSVTSIGESAFDGCKGLTSVTIPNSVTSIGDRAFAYSGLTFVTIPNSVTSIGSVFQGCSDLTSVTIPNSVTSIGKRAFFGCGLTSVTIPNSVTSIGEDAFCFCMNLTTVKGLRSQISIGENAFTGCPFANNYDKTFEYTANSVIIPQIKEWQQKRDFETTAQYQARVTKENQQRKVQELMQEAIKEYTKKYPINVTLGNYDADYGIYTLNSNYGQKHVKVPLSEAPRFKEGFKDATFDASYIPTEDGLQVNDLTINLNGKKYQVEKVATEIASSTIDIDLPDVEIPLASQPQQQVAQKPSVTIDKSIDQNIPSGLVGNSKTFAVIIGNEQYTQVAKVPHAANDAKVFAEYCQKTLGMPTNNVRQYNNATFGTMLTAINDIKSIVQAYKGDVNVIFYYAGHGIPNETTHDAFLLPVDANGRQTEACYPVSRLYKELGEMGAKNVIVFMDACFSGSQRGEGMLASARSVAIKAKANSPQGNMVVFSAATGDETAYPYQEKGHGMFTYFLLKKLRESKGDCTLGELGEYIQTNVQQQSIVINRKSQTPTIVPSGTMVDSWRSLKLK